MSMATAANHTVSAGAAGATLGTFAGSLLGILPPIVTVVVGVLAAIWYVVALIESDTVQTWWRGREYVRLRKRQIAAAKVLKIAQEADAKALAAFQAAEARALVVRQKADPSSSSPAPAPTGSTPTI